MGDDINSKKISSILQYKKGMKIYGLKIKKIYFVNDDKKFIILKAEEDNTIYVFGGNLSKIEYLLSECKYLTESLRTSKKEIEMFDYQRATAMNSFLLGEEENSEKMLVNLKEKLEKRKILFKKLWYIGIFFIVTILMIIFSLTTIDLNYSKFVKIATFGAIGGFISLNIRLEEVKFEISDSTISYIIVSLYKVMFSMLASIIVYFLIESNLIFEIKKSENSNQLYILYVIGTLAGFSERFLPNVFNHIEESGNIEA